MGKELLFTLTKKDFVVQTFKAGGKGGQHQNKTDSGVRIMHKDSGAVGESRSEKSQNQNKKIAFRRMVESEKFQLWHKLVAGEMMKGKTIAQQVDDEMHPSNFKIETRETGKWMDINE